MNITAWLVGEAASLDAVTVKTLGSAEAVLLLLLHAGVPFFSPVLNKKNTNEVLRESFGPLRLTLLVLQREGSIVLPRTLT